MPCADHAPATASHAVDAVVDAMFPGMCLRRGQREVIDHVLRNPASDVICTFPTGYGKSLCYIVPALVRQQSCLVVSPLCSLIQDQCAKLNAGREDALAYNFTAGAANADDIFCDDRGGKGARFLFCTPERLAGDAFRRKLAAWHRASPFLYIVVDEAHLVAEHGYTFRPDYLKVGAIRSVLEGVAVLCFSATCNQHVQTCLRDTLLLRNVREFAPAPAAAKPVHIALHDTAKNGTCTCGSAACTWPRSRGIQKQCIRGHIHVIWVCWETGVGIYFSVDPKHLNMAH